MSAGSKSPTLSSRGERVNAVQRLVTTAAGGAKDEEGAVIGKCESSVSEGGMRAKASVRPHPGEEGSSLLQISGLLHDPRDLLLRERQRGIHARRAGHRSGEVLRHQRP